MNLPNQIVITLKAKHFKETEFAFCGDCAIEKAVKERFNVSDVSEFVFGVSIWRNDYWHKAYTKRLFDLDSKTAGTHAYDETPIRKIKLKKR